MDEFDLEVTRIQNEHAQRSKEASDLAEGLGRGAFKGQSECDSITARFAKLDGSQIGGIPCKWFGSAGQFVFGDSYAQFAYGFPHKSNLAEGNITISKSRPGPPDMSIVLHPSVDNDGRFFWILPNQGGDLLTSAAVAAFVLSRLHETEAVPS